MVVVVGDGGVAGREGGVGTGYRAEKGIEDSLWG